MMQCHFCFKSFEPQTHNAAYCSQRCKRSQENANKREKRAQGIQKAGMVPTTRWTTSPDQRIFIVPDTHVGYHDERAWSLLLNAVAAYQPTKVVVLGDFLDCEGLSRFPSNPTSSHGIRLQQDVDVARELLGQLVDAAPTAEREFIEGNHELRISKWVMTHAPGLYGLQGLELERMLGLEDLGYGYTHYDDCVELAPGMIAIHGKMISKHSAWSAQKEADRWQVSGVSGHTHRLGVFHQTTYDGYRFWLECGYMGRMDVPGAQATSNWQQGFGTVTIVDGNPWPNAHRIVDGKTIVEGKVIRA